MKRRNFLTGLVAGTAAATGLIGCGREQDRAAPADSGRRSEFDWKMVTTWPQNFPALGTGANRLAELINRMSDGRIRIRVYGAGELVPAFEVFDAVAQGTAEMGHGAAYYWKGKIPAAQMFSAVPFGMTYTEMDAWLQHGGGLDLWRRVYAEYGLVPAPAGNTGIQMAGWFNRPIESAGDLDGLKMRIPGLGGEVLKRAGGTPVNLPGGELFTSLKTGAIDATEWVGPYNDQAFGLHKAAEYYYYPGWHEPGATLETVFSKKAFDQLPADLQAVVLNACRVANHDILLDMTANNAKALSELEEKGVKVRRLPDDALRRLREMSREVMQEMAQSSDLAREIYDSYHSFQKRAAKWTAIAEEAYLRARSL